MSSRAEQAIERLREGLDNSPFDMAVVTIGRGDIEAVLREVDRLSGELARTKEFARGQKVMLDHEVATLKAQVMRSVEPTLLATQQDYIQRAATADQVAQSDQVMEEHDGREGH